MMEGIESQVTSLLLCVGTQIIILPQMILPIILLTKEFFAPLRLSVRPNLAGGYDE